MKLSEKQLLLQWVTTEKLRLSDEYIGMLQRIRYQKSDVVDFLEMIIIQQRLQDFDEFSKNMVYLLHLDID